MSDTTIRTRSKAYPAVTLGEALKKTDKINDNYGLSGSYNRETIAAGMGYGSLSGTASRAVAALAQYGLLNRIKDQYELSPLARKYLTPMEDHDLSDAKREAALSPALFAEIYSKFAGQLLPKQFVNRLINEFGIQQKAAADVERIFKATMETAGILLSNGILSDSSSVKQARNDSPTPSANSGSKQANDLDEHRQQLSPETNADFLSVELPSGLHIGYSQELASAFAFGAFGDQLKALDNKVSDYKKTNQTPAATTPVSEEERDM